MRNDELLLGLLLCCLRTLTPNLGTLDAPAIATPSGEAQERRISLSTTHCTLETLGDLCLTLLQCYVSFDSSSGAEPHHATSVTAVGCQDSKTSRSPLDSLINSPPPKYKG